MPRRAPNSEQPRSKVLPVRLTPDEHAEVLAAAQAANMTASAYGARTLTGRRVVIEKRQSMDPALFAEIKRIGNNINQLTRAVNRDRHPDAHALIGSFKELFDHLIRDELMKRRIEAAPNDNRRNPVDPEETQTGPELQRARQVPAAR